MVAAKVWEAVETFNARTSIGRVVVNPPDRRGEVKAHPTLESWYFCKCGKAFSNPDSYVLHRKTHGNGNISLQIPLALTPVKNDKKLEVTAGRGIKKPLGAKVTIRKKIEEGRKVPVRPDPSERRIRRVGFPPKGIKSIKGIKLHSKEDVSVRPIWSPPVSQSQQHLLQSNVHRCTQCEQIFILAAHLKAHIRIKHTPSLIGKIKEAAQVELRLPRARVELKLPTSTPTLDKRLPGKKEMSAGAAKNEMHCKLCPATFSSKIGFFQHLKAEHGGEGLNSCPHCPKKTLSSESLQSHVNSFHKMTEPTIGVNTRSTGMKKVEEGSDSNVGALLVDVDNLKTDDPPKDLKNYTSTRSGNHEKLPLIANKRSTASLPRCKICNRPFYSAAVLQSHMLRKHKTREVRTERKTSTKNAELVSSVTSPGKLSREEPPRKRSLLEAFLSGSVGAENKAASENQSKHFSVIATRTRSRRSTDASDPTICEDVPNTTEAPEILPDKKDTVDTGPKVPAGEDFTCQLCGVFCETRRGLVHHRRERHPVKNYLKCKVCSLQFTTLNRLKKHGLRHVRATRQRNAKVFKTSNDHAVNLPGPITDESKSDVSLKNAGIKNASQVSDLELVETTTATDTVQEQEQKKRKLDCKLCEKTFVHSFSLSQHVKNHSSQFLCDTCGTGFSVQTNLDLHLEKAHFPGGQFSCKICPCVYEHQRGLASHVAHRHQKKVDDVSKIRSNQTRPSKETVGADHTPSKAYERNSRLLPAVADETTKNPQTFTETGQTKPLDALQTLIECKICGCQIIKDLYETHLKDAHVASGKFPCPQCTCVFESRQGLSVHKRTLHFYKNKQPVMKPVPTKRAISSPLVRVDSSPKGEIKLASGKLLVEEASASNKAEWSSCTLCRLSIPGGAEELRKHLQIAHVNPSTFRCQHCSCSFRDRRSLIVHMTNVVHPPNDQPLEPLFLTQSSKGTVQVVPHFRPIITQSSLAVLNTAEIPMSGFPWNSPEAVVHDKASTSEVLEENVPKIISYYSQNPEYIKKQSPVKNNELDVIICEETDPLDISNANLSTIIETEAMKLKQSKEIQSVKINQQLSVSVVTVNGNGKVADESGISHDTSGTKKSSKVSEFMKTINRRKQILKKKSLLPPPPTELATVSTEYQLPFAIEPLQVKPVLNGDSNSPRKGSFGSECPPTSNDTNVNKTVTGLFSSPMLRPIRPEVTIQPVPTTGLSNNDTTDDCNTWSLSTLLGTSSTDEGYNNRHDNASGTDSWRRKLGFGSETQVDPLNIVLDKGFNAEESKSTSQNKTRLATCTICARSFFSQQKLMRHMKVHEDEEKRTWKPGGKCGYCGQNFDVHSALWAHLKECRGSKPTNQATAPSNAADTT